MILAYNQTKCFHNFIVSWSVFNVDLETLKPFSFQMSIVMLISSPFVSSIRVYFDQGWSEKKTAIAFGRNSDATGLWQALAF